MSRALSEKPATLASIENRRILARLSIFLFGNLTSWIFNFHYKTFKVGSSISLRESKGLKHQSGRYLFARQPNSFGHNHVCEEAEPSSRIEVK
jgi:hypothetical protein